jgi:hypothetical protein
MSNSGAFSLSIRIAAAGLFFAGMATYSPPARSAVFQASTAFPQVPNLVGYWPMNSVTSGITRDMSGTSPANDGALSGSASIDTVNKAAVPAGNPASLAVSANGDIVSVPDSPSLSVTGSVTVAAWIRPTVAAVTSGGTQHGIIEKWDWNGSTATNGFLLRLTPKNELTFSIANASGNNGAGTYPRAVPTNVWTHVAGVYNSAGGVVQTYKSDDDASDGGAADPSTASGVALPTNGLASMSIGDGQGAQQFGGNIDEARIYTKALTQAEIAILVSMVQPPATTFAAGATGSQVTMTWNAASNAGSVPVVYTILRGTSSGVYTTAINNVSGSPYTDTPPTAGTYYYTISAVSVIPSAYATEQVVTTTAAPPPPPPPPTPTGPRVADEEDRNCGCGTTSPLQGGVAGALALSAGLLLLLVARRS